MKMVAFCFLISISSASGKYSMQQLLSDRSAATFRERRVIYNNDGDANLRRVGVTPQTFLDSRTTGIETTQVDSIFFCTGLTVMFSHETEIGDRFGYNGLGGEGKSWPAELDLFGVDSLGLQVEFARQHNKEIFWSLRMNDSHDSFEDCLWPTWKSLNPDALMGAPGDNFAAGKGRWSTLDYALPKVRAHILSIIEEVCLNYDIDGIELDFFRHPLFFKEVMMGGRALPKSVETMTDFIREIRVLTEEISLARGKPILIAVKIPDSLDYCTAIGLNVRWWLAENLIDIVVGGGYFKLEPWANLVAIGKRYHVPVYAAMEPRSIMTTDQQNNIDDFKKRFRGEALAAWNSGVDGIYTFNLWFNTNSAKAELFNELGDPAILNASERIDGESYLMEAMPPQTWLRDGHKFLNISEPFSNLDRYAATALPVLNNSFESPAVTSSGGYFRLDQGAPGSGWAYSATNAPTPAILLIDTEVYTQVPIPSGYDGTQIISLSARKNSTADYGVPNTICQQVMGGAGQRVLADRDKLLLSVSLARASAYTNRNFSFGLYGDPDLTQELAVRVSTDSDPIELSRTEFGVFSLEWIAGYADAGHSVYVGLKSEDYGVSASTIPRLAIDKVRLDLIPGCTLLPVSNGSFELPEVTSAGGYSRMDQGAPGTGWEYSAPNAPTPAILLIDTEVYTQAPIPTGYDGVQIVSLSARKNTTEDYGTPNAIYQQVMGGLGQRVLADRDKLLLKVSLAQASSRMSRNYSFGLYGDSALTDELAVCVSTDSIPIGLSEAEFEVFNLEWIAGHMDVGRPVYIGFKSEDYGTSAGATPRLEIDKVQLGLIPGGTLLSISNNSFEFPAVTSSGGYSRIDQGAPGTEWAFIASNAPTPAILLIDTEVYAQTIPAGCDGVQFMTLSARKNSMNDYGAANCVYQQVMGGTGQRELAAGEKLRVTASLAGLGTELNQNFCFGLYGDPFLTNVLAEFVSTSDFPVMLSHAEFEKFSLIWEAGEEDAGTPVYIGFKSQDYGLSASTTPRLAVSGVWLELISP